MSDLEKCGWLTTIVFQLALLIIGVRMIFTENMPVWFTGWGIFMVFLACVSGIVSGIVLLMVANDAKNEEL